MVPHAHSNAEGECEAEGAEWKIIPALYEDGPLLEIAILMLEYHYKAPSDLLEMLTNAGFFCFLRDLRHIKHSEIGNIYAVTPGAYECRAPSLSCPCE
jgi:hypothetical protein